MWNSFSNGITTNGEWSGINTNFVNYFYSISCVDYSTSCKFYDEVVNYVDWDDNFWPCKSSCCETSYLSWMTPLPLRLVGVCTSACTSIYCASLFWGKFGLMPLGLAWEYGRLSGDPMLNTSKMYWK
jgi:hypothetical protein